MKNLLLFSFIICTLPRVFSQVTFERVILNPTTDEEGYSVAQTSDHGYIMSGLTRMPNPNMYIVKTDSAGALTWSKTFQNGLEIIATSVEQTTDGGYIIGGYREATSAGETYVIKANSSGDTLWTKILRNNIEVGFTVHQTADSGYAIASVTSDGFTYAHAHLTKLNSSGSVSWNKKYGPAFPSGTQHVTTDFRQLSDHGYLMAGYINPGSAGGKDVFVIRTDSAGTLLWSREVGGVNDEFENSIVAAADGGFVIVGETNSFGAGNTDVYLIKLNAAGDTLWTRTYGGTAADAGKAAVETADGGYLVTGYTYSFGTGLQDILVMKTDVNGVLQWSKSFGELNFYKAGANIQHTADGGYIITGNRTDFLFTNGDIFLLKLDSSGNATCNQVNGTLTQSSPASQAYTINLSTSTTGSVISLPWTIGAIGIDSLICMSFTGVHETTYTSSFTVYPNPAHNILNVECNTSVPLSATTLKMYDVMGRMVLEVEIHSQLSTFNPEYSGLTPGIYFIKVLSEKETFTGKLLIE